MPLASPIPHPLLPRSLDGPCLLLQGPLVPAAGALHGDDAAEGVGAGRHRRENHRVDRRRGASLASPPPSPAPLAPSPLWPGRPLEARSQLPQPPTQLSRYLMHHFPFTLFPFPGRFSLPGLPEWVPIQNVRALKPLIRTPEGTGGVLSPFLSSLRRGLGAERKKATPRTVGRGSLFLPLPIPGLRLTSPHLSPLPAQ